LRVNAREEVEMGRRPIKDQRRGEILDALYRCLMRKSFKETSIKDIAREAGINSALLHYYFASKEDILINLVDQILGHYRDLYLEYVRGLEERDLPFRELLRQVFQFSNEQITTNKDLQRVFFEIWEVSLHNRNVNARVRKVYREWIRGLGELMQRGARNPEEAAQLALAAVAFQEGIGLLSVIFDFGKKRTREALETFQEKILELV
jgi:AcrR family transcriptional regulator